MNRLKRLWRRIVAFISILSETTKTLAALLTILTVLGLGSVVVGYFSNALSLIITGIVVFIVSVLLFIFLYTFVLEAIAKRPIISFLKTHSPHVSFRHQPRIPISQSHPNGSLILECAKKLGMIEVFRPPLRPNLISAKVHKQIRLEPDERMRTAFEDLNRVLKDEGKRGFFPSTRYRLVRPPYPTQTAQGLIYSLDLGITDWVFYALLQHQYVDPDTKQYVREMIHALGPHIPSSLRTTHPFLNASNYGLLGIGITLITNDGYTLLRRRGKDVLEYAGSWDVSFSGYCGEDALHETDHSWDELEIIDTIFFELKNELRALKGDPREIVLTGLHRDEKTWATVIHGYWKIQEKRDDLARRVLNPSSPSGAREFPTTIKAIERYVWDAKNLLAPFDGPAIADALRKTGKAFSESQPLILPGAHAGLLLALHACGKSTHELEDMLA